MIRLMKMMFYDKARHGIGLAYEASSKSIRKSEKITVQTMVYRLYGLSEEEIGIVEGVYEKIYI